MADTAAGSNRTAGRDVAEGRGALDGGKRGRAEAGRGGESLRHSYAGSSPICYSISASRPQILKKCLQWSWFSCNNWKRYVHGSYQDTACALQAGSKLLLHLLVNPPTGYHIIERHFLLHNCDRSPRPYWTRSLAIPSPTDVPFRRSTPLTSLSVTSSLIAVSRNIYARSEAMTWRTVYLVVRAGRWRNIIG